MAYLVNITSRAERDLAHRYQEINAEYSEATLKWYRGLKQTILSLKNHPNRCPTTLEKEELRHLLSYGHKPHVYRVIFRVLGETEASRRAPHPTWRETETQKDRSSLT